MDCNHGLYGDVSFSFHKVQFISAFLLQVLIPPSTEHDAFLLRHRRTYESFVVRTWVNEHTLAAILYLLSDGANMAWDGMDPVWVNDE
jgi:hypothetical protein